MPQLVTHPLGQFWVWPDSVGEALARGAFWDEHLRPTLDRGNSTGWVIDIGASTGFLTTYLAQRYPRVIAVEAHPTTFALLLKNLALNQIQEVVLPYHLAAYHTHAFLRLCTAAEIGWALPDQLNLDGAVCASGVAFRPDDHLVGLLVPAAPVDALVPPTTHVSLIKIDAQGCDLRALHGLTRTIQRCRPLILFEYESISESWHGDSFAAYETFFAERSYQVTQIDSRFSDFLAVPQ